MTDIHEPGGTVWFTGLPSAGKSTLANALAAELGGRAVEVLDGDELRRQVTSGLGFSRQDRDMNVTLLGYVAEKLAGHGVLVLVAAIAPYADTREQVRKHHAVNGLSYLEVHVATPLETCRERDVKGLYARQSRGELSFTVRGLGADRRALIGDQEAHETGR